jgi:zinc protease
MVLRGTRKHSFQQIHDELDRMRAELAPLESWTVLEKPGEAGFQVTTSRESVPAVLALLAEIVREPSFPKEEFERLKKQQLATLEEELQKPDTLAYGVLSQKADPWPKDDARYHASPAERVERLKAVRLEQLIDFHKNFWGGQGGSLVVVGDFDAAQAKTIAEKELGGWKAPRPYVRIPRPFRASSPADEIIRTHDKQMALVGLAEPLELRDDDPDYPAVAVGDYLFGYSAASRLWERLREKEGLSYGAFSLMDAQPFERSALFLATAICAPGNAVKALASMVDELERLVKKGVSAGELAEGKKGYQAAFDQKLANDQSLAELLDKALFAGRTLGFYKARLAQMQALTPADVLAALQRHLRPEGIIKIKAGDLKD